MTTVAARSAGGAASSAAVDSLDWRAAAIAMLPIRVIQGFIYWGGGSLSALPASAIVNDFPYNRFKPGPYGLEAGMGAKAIVTLPPMAHMASAASAAQLRVTDVDGRTFASSLGPA